MTVAPELQQALEVYFHARGLMFQEVPEFSVFRTGSLRGFHNHPRWPERDSFYAVNVEPGEVVAAVRAYRPDPCHMITVFADSVEPLREDYARLGYKEMGGPAQPFMGKPLDGLYTGEESGGEVRVCRVRDAKGVAFINSVGEVMKPSHLDAGVFRYYYIECDGRPVCTGRYVMTPHSAIYVAGMDTHPEYRRLGLASALMARMHRDATEEGAAFSILCSSLMGLGLYHAVGYDVLANMYGFVPNA